MLDEAQELLEYAAAYLQKPIPDLPIITIDPDCKDLGQIHWGWLGTKIILRHWRDTAFDRSVLVHELVHHLQAQDEAIPDGAIDPYEVEAITVQLRYLQVHGVDPRTAISQVAIIKMTKSEEFAKLEWL